MSGGADGYRVNGTADYQVSGVDYEPDGDLAAAGGRSAKVRQRGVSGKPT